jgi:hypothetical protein
MPASELRGELARLLSANGGDGGVRPQKRPAPAPASKAKKEEPKAKKRR